jgi:hypothetical protein
VIHWYLLTFWSWFIFFYCGIFWRQACWLKKWGDSRNAFKIKYHTIRISINLFCNQPTISAYWKHSALIESKQKTDSWRVSLKRARFLKTGSCKQTEINYTTEEFVC